MFNIAGRQSVTLDTLGGLVTLAGAPDLPEGASPRNWDVDFTVGNVGTRPGLDSAFVYDGGTLTHDASSAVSESPAIIPWQNPGNILLNDGTYTTVTLGLETLSKTWIPSLATDVHGFDTPWTTPSNILTTGAAYATNNPSGAFSDVLQVTNGAPTSVPAGAVITGVEVSFKALGAGFLVSANLIDSNQGISPNNQIAPVTSTLTTYTLGSSTYKWGFTSLSAGQVATLGAQIQAHRITGGATIDINSFNITVFYQYTEDETSDDLLVTEWGYDISNTSQVVSLGVGVTGYATVAGTVVTGQLTFQGNPFGSPQSIVLPVGTPSTTYFSPSGWLAQLTPQILNNTSFGIVLTATSLGAVLLDFIQMKANIAAQSVNFNYVKSGLYQIGAADGAGDIQTLALDSDGNLWNDPNFSGELSLLLNNIAQGSYGKSVSLDSREYICFSDLSTGTDIPLQYVPNDSTSPSYWIDRVSQVGPGAAPSFSAALTTSAQGAITSWSITSNVATFQCSNSFTAGEIVTITGLVTGAFFNGQSFNVLGAGLSVSQFEVSITHADASATEGGYATPQYGYAIASISQPAQQVTEGQHPGTFTAQLWSEGPGSQNSGNVMTIYYLDAAQNSSGDTSLINAFNSGDSVYVYVSGAQIGNGTQLVTSVNHAKAPGGQNDQYYFTYQMPTANYQLIGVTNNSAVGHYQQTVATLTSVLPIPGLVEGNQISITGASQTGYDATFLITAALKSGSYAITQTQMTSGTGTYTYSATGATTVAPTIGQLVTVTGTLNGNGVFNVTDAIITWVSGSTSGTFTVANFPGAQTIPASIEAGQATSAGVSFQFDPGVATLGTQTSPIFGTSTGGQLAVITGSGAATQVIGSGTRQGTVLFETRNGFLTAPGPPVTFTTPNNTNYIYAAAIPLGPPNTVARWICFTEAGSNNVAGGNFYTIPSPVTFTVNGVNYLSSALVINDNTTTQATFTFSDQVLLAATAIDVQGNNLFNQIELGNPAWNVAYADRMFYGGCNAKIQNFNNLTFDGGYTATFGGGNLVPLGWSIPDNPSTGFPSAITAYQIASDVATIFAGNTFAAGQQVYMYGLTTGTYFNDLVFTVLGTGLSSTQFQVKIINADVTLTYDSGDAIAVNYGSTLLMPAEGGRGLSYYTQNSTATFQAQMGLIFQSAYQDYESVNILNSNTLYSVRVTCRNSSATFDGNLTIDLTDLLPGTAMSAPTWGSTYASFTVPRAGMLTSFVTYTGPLVFTGSLANKGFSTVPSTLQLRVFAENLQNGSDLEIDRIEIFPTQNPVDQTIVYASYVNNFEAFDGVTGQLGLSTNNAQPVMGAVELFDSLYFLKTGSMYVTEDSPGEEPSSWDIKEVSNTVGAIGPNAFAVGEQYIITACRQGLYLFQGKQPGKLNHEIYQIWNAINWSAGNSIWVRNDTTNRKIYVGVPLPTGPGTTSYTVDKRGQGGWLPNATANTNPTYPNVVLMCSYEGLDNATEMETEGALHTTMFGTLNATDMRRKWTIWQIPSPYADFVIKDDGVTAPITFGTGKNTSQILALDPDATEDAGVPINGTYCTYGFVDAGKASQNPLLGFHNKVFNCFQALVTGAGTCAVEFFQNSLNAQYPYTIPGGLNLYNNPNGENDFEKPLNVQGQRVFVQFSTSAVREFFSLSKMIMVGSKALLNIRGNIM
jgi:hypothetical protein